MRHRAQYAVFATLLLPYLQASAQFDGIAQIPYLSQIVTENIRRYEQLREMIRNSKERDAYMRLINEGIDNAVGVALSLPVEDQKILEELKTFKQAAERLKRLYGDIPKSPDAPMFRLHDESVAESIRLVNDLKDYAREQEKNAESLFLQSGRASPKGAGRMATATNAQILHALSQLIRINGQMLKLQSQSLGMENRIGKDEVDRFDRVNRDFDDIPGNYPGAGAMPRF